MSDDAQAGTISGAEFVKAAEAIIEPRSDAEVKQLLDDIEEELRADDVPPKRRRRRRLEQRLDVTPDYGTPEDFLDLVRATFGGPIGLDPCTAPHNPTRARTYYTPIEDGLAPYRPWRQLGPVFMNPPYGKRVRLWTGKMAREFPDEALLLLPARTDTAWFQAIYPYAEEVCWWRGRMVFIDPATGKPAVDAKGKPQTGMFPSVVLYWGQHRGRFRAVFRDRGQLR